MTPDGFHIAPLPDGEGRWARIRGLALVGLTLAFCLPGLALVVGEHRARAQATTAYWTVEGKACQPLAAAAFDAISRPPMETSYAGAVFLRHGGAMMCIEQSSKLAGRALAGPVCKFTAPDYLAVSAGGQMRYFDLTQGRSAAVGVVGDQVRCVEIPRFSM